MARIGEADVARRYDGIGVGPRTAYLFETQAGLPIDGTNARLRELSPFTLRLLPPDALLAANVGSLVVDNALVGSSTKSTSVDLVSAAALATDGNQRANGVADALSGVSGIGNLSVERIAALGAFVANGRFVQDQGSGSTFISTLADAFVAADIALQIARILEAPPLTLLVNPAEMSVSRTKLQSYQTRTRKGYVFEAWGTDQATLSISGSTGGFVAGAVDTTNPFGGQVTGEAASVTGYQGAARLDSAAWQNFTSLYHFYRNNGYIYDTIGKSEAHHFIGAVAIDYDQWTYVGHIESFSFRFEESSPHRVTFEMEFRASRIYDRDLSSSAVAMMRGPTSGTNSSGAGTALGVRQAPDLARGLEDEDVASVPLDLLGGF